MNVKFEYLYRDGDNYKAWGAVVLTGGGNAHELREWQKRIQKRCFDGEGFIAHQVGVPEVFLWSSDADYDVDDPSTYPSGLGAGNYVINDADHCYHEFSELVLTNEPPSDPRTPEAFVEAFEAASRAGWKGFIPTKTRRSA